MPQISKITIATYLCVSCSIATNAFAQSYTTTWEGDSSSNMNDGANWDNGNIGREATTVFDDPSTATFQPDIPTGAPNNRAEVNALVFNQAGWNITTDGTTHVAIWNNGGSPYITSNGTGTNVIGSVRTVSPVSVTTGTGNTLIIQSNSTGSMNYTTKDGAGAFVVNGDMGQIPDVNAGSLFINGTMYHHGNDVDTVASGATLGGSGSISENNSHTIEFQSGSTFAPGMSTPDDATADTFTMRNDRQLASGERNYDMNLLSGSSMRIGIFDDGSSDLFYITGDANSSSRAQLSIDSGVILALEGDAASGVPYTIVTADLAGTFTGEFDSVTLNGIALSESEYSTVYTAHNAQAPGTGSIVITLDVVPEPQTYVLVGLTGLAVIGLRLRRRR